MRITNGIMISNMMTAYQNNMNAMDKDQQKLSTGKKFILPSDDPIAVSKSLRLNTDISESEQYKKNCDDAVSWMTLTEDTIDKVQSVLNRLHDLALTSSNGSQTDANRKATADEAKQLKDQLISLGNATYAGRYIFSGFKTDQPLFSATGTNAGQYNITVGEITTDQFAKSTDAIGASGTLSFKDSDGVVVTPANPANMTYTAGNPSAVPLVSATTWENLRDNINNDANLKTAGITASIEPPPVAPSTYSVNAKLVITSTAKKVSSTQFTSSDTVIGSSGTLVFKKADGTTVSPASAANLTYTSTTTWKQLAANINSDTNLQAAGITASIVPPSGTNARLVINPPTVTEASGLLNNSEAVQYTETSGLISNTESMDYKVGVADQMGINVIGTDVFGVGSKGDVPKMIDDLNKFISALTTDTSSKDPSIIKAQNDGIQNAITAFNNDLDVSSKVRSELGAKISRANLTSNRLDDEDVNFTKLLTDNENIDYEEVFTNLTNERNVYNAALTIGAKVIQQSLVDFLR